MRTDPTLIRGWTRGLARHKAGSAPRQWPAGRDGSGSAKIVRAFWRLALCAALLAATPALAQATHIAAALTPERAIAAPGETVLLAVTMRPERGWHGYWENGGDAGFGMTLNWHLPPGARPISSGRAACNGRSSAT